MIPIDRIDHLVLTVADIDATCAFYSGLLGFEVITFAGGRKALRFGRQKVNLHAAGHEFEPKAAQPTPGSADLCLVTELAITEVAARLAAASVPVEDGPVARSGALGAITSLYIRDPDQNLIEIAHYDN